MVESSINDDPDPESYGSLDMERKGIVMRRMRTFLAATSLVSFLLGSAATVMAQQPIASISTKMTGVVGELAKTETGPPVQDHQKAIVRDLDELIASLEKECENCRGGMKRNKPREGLNDSVIGRGTGGVGDLVDPRQSEKDWAKLSTRERDRILQSMSEGFPPEYRQVLERYYRRLAEEKTVRPEAEGAKAKPADQP